MRLLNIQSNHAQHFIEVNKMTNIHIKLKEIFDAKDYAYLLEQYKTDELILKALKRVYPKALVKRSIS